MTTTVVIPATSQPRLTPAWAVSSSGATMISGSVQPIKSYEVDPGYRTTLAESLGGFAGATM
ncbi:MAG: hypothetical protein KDA78_19695, partial [Planctomycetaceae bacterium]|nr:hypothetical protein [Planctomycetaceae bacterium]